MKAEQAVSVIRAKRDGERLSVGQIGAFVTGLVDGRWSEGQAAALAMAIVWRGMDRDETVALTRAMVGSGERLDWRRAGLEGPFLDKHSTGGVGDKVSLMLAPIVAACGAQVPMISGRGLGHTGGTLDKLSSFAGYCLDPDRARFTRVLRDAGCAIVSAGSTLAPADRRLYAIRDVTATVESVPLIVASILSKKLAAGLDALVMDVKVGNGAFRANLAQAQELAHALVDVAGEIGLPTRAVLTDMNQVLGRHAGNALELREAVDFLTGSAREPRLLELTLELAAQMLHQGGLAADLAAGRVRALQALDSGAAAERFARMVAGMGGPGDALSAALPQAPVVRPLPAWRQGVLAATDTRALGEVVVALGGGRRRADDVIDLRVGLAEVLPLGSRVQQGQPLLLVHAADQGAADVALLSLRQALTIAEAAAAPGPPVLLQTL